MKRFISLLLSLLMVLSLAVPSFASGGSASAGYVTVSLEAATLGLGFVAEPQKVPFYDGESVAHVTQRYLEQLGVTYSSGGEVDNGFYLIDIQTTQTAEERESSIDVPQVILTMSGKTLQDYLDNPPSGTALGQMSYSSQSGWLSTMASVKGFASVGASDILALDGDTVRWQLSIEGYGVDLGYDTGWGDPPPYNQADKDALLALIAAINSASNKDEILAQDGVASAYNTAVEICENLTSSNNEVQEALSALSATSGVSADYIATKGGGITTLSGAEVIPGQAVDLGGQTTDDPIKAEALAHLDTTLAYIVGTSVQNPAFGDEWAILALARGDYNVADSYYSGYVADATGAVSDASGLLSTTKLTEHSRLILALSAMGTEPFNIGGYDVLKPLANYENIIKQGINGPIYALLAMDTNDYVFTEQQYTDVPEEGKNTRRKMIEYILSQEITGGGFALSGSTPDPDITSTVIQSLTPYYGGNELLKAEFGADTDGYNALIAEIGSTVNNGIAKLSEIQQDDGGFASWGTATLESTAQVVLTLVGLGIDPLTDSRFIKGDNTLLDGMMKYAVAGGGFGHTSNTTADGMATEQGGMALVALDRFYDGQSGLYDMGDAFGEVQTTEGVSLVMPEKIDGTVGTQFSAVVKVGSWSDSTIRVIDGVYSIPDSLEVVGVTMGSQITGGALNYNLDEGKLRFAYMSDDLGEVSLNTTTFPAELMSITLRLKQTMVNGSKIDISTDSIGLRSSSDLPAENLDITSAKNQVEVMGSGEVMTATPRVLYIGDDSDLIPSDKQAVAVEFVNLPEDSKVMFGGTELSYSQEISTKKGVDTYVALFDSAVSVAELGDISSYTITQEAFDSITFADTNDDGVINAQDSLNTLSLWLRKTAIDSDKQILVSNVNADKAINTADVLAIIELIVNARELDIVTK